MNQTAWRCLTAFWIAAQAATAPLAGAAQESGPSTGAPTHSTLAKPADSLPDSKMGKRETYPFRGVIGSVDPTTRQVTLTGKNSRRVIAIVGDTRLTRDGSPATLQDLKAGEAVGGTLRKTGDGREEALLIRVGLKPEGTKAGAKAKTKTKARTKGLGQGKAQGPDHPDAEAGSP